jgi:tRNA-Thr(GGU) m(6)t(6)A37 methyltransferase TsaA
VAAVNGYQVVPIGWVESPLTDRAQAPRQGDEGAPDAWLVFEPGVAEGIRDLGAGTEILVLTWLDRAARDVLVTRPRGDPARPPTGVFSTRSPDRPNPIGLHRVRIVATDGLRVLVRPLEALDKTPILDVKPVLDKTAER